MYEVSRVVSVVVVGTVVGTSVVTREVTVVLEQERELASGTQRQVKDWKVRTCTSGTRSSPRYR